MAYPSGKILLQNYRIEKSIGQGAFGEVYLATHTRLNGQRAVKVLLRDDIGVGSSDYDEYRNRFRQESQLMELFKDPHLVMVYDFQEEDNTLFLIMEYAAGGSLKQRLDTLKKDGRLFSVEETVKIGIDIARGLAALHQKDVVHRDLKPSNILFDADGNAKVADLGLAQIPGGASMRSQLSVPKPHPGTPAYMSPEQETAGSYLRPASDINSLGLILFEMLTRRSYKSLRPGTRLKTLAPESPEWLDDLLAQMLSENPKDRPWDGVEVINRLLNCNQDRLSEENIKNTNQNITDKQFCKEDSTHFIDQPEKKSKNNRIDYLSHLGDGRDIKEEKVILNTIINRKPMVLILGVLFFLSILFYSFFLRNFQAPVIPTTQEINEITPIVPIITNTVAPDFYKILVGTWHIKEVIFERKNGRVSMFRESGTIEFGADGNVGHDYIKGSDYRAITGNFGKFNVSGDVLIFSFGNMTDKWQIKLLGSPDTLELSKLEYVEMQLVLERIK